MTEKTALPLAPDADLTEKVLGFKRTFEADVMAIKLDLAQWLDGRRIGPISPRAALHVLGLRGADEIAFRD
jgi:hypothetical protein